MSLETPVPLISFAEAESLSVSYTAALAAIPIDTLDVNVLNVDAYLTFLTPKTLEAEYASASNSKKLVMAGICYQVFEEAAPDFKARYTEIYNELYP